MIATQIQQPEHGPGASDAPPEAGAAMRRCLASGEIRPKAELLRFVISPDGDAVPDFAGRLPGRGFWLLPRRDMIDKACDRRLFSRAARVSVKVPQDLADQVERALRERCLDLLGLARRSGVLTAGYEKVRSRLSSAPAGALVEAADGAAGGRGKLEAFVRGAMPDLPIVALFSATELGRALGRESVVHVLLARGRLAEKFLAESARYAAAKEGETNKTLT
jgi:hypothetical protein